MAPKQGTIARPVVDQKELKRIVAALKAGTIEGLGSRADHPPPPKSRPVIRKMLEPVPAKVGLDAGRIDGLLAQDRKVARGLFDKQQAVAAKRFPAANRAYQSASAARRAALGLLSNPFVSSFVTLDKPFLIWQLPNPQSDIFIGSNVESMNSSINVLVNVDAGANFTEFVFYFLWQNETDSAAVINISTSLVANGSCFVQAKPGILSGDRAFLDIFSFLTLMRWSGFGSDPVTGASLDQTADTDDQPSQNVYLAALEADGGHIFDSADFHSQSFDFQKFSLTHDLFVVPARAVVVFQVSLFLQYGFDGGGDIQDGVFVDFAKNGNAVICPNVELELLTPAANVKVGIP